MIRADEAAVWTTACSYDRLIPGVGVGVLLDNGKQAALFRLDDGSVHAICNVDPFFRAAVLSRGIVGDRGGRWTVASPLKKQIFAFDDGSCLDDPRFAVQVFPTRITAAGNVQIGRAA
ncbi:MAG TPA: nitrite reductase small subunit NirD [Mycobacterium sp.]|nr:nitrite reductase small subunit NirD [Mycobacterium sp.]